MAFVAGYKTRILLGDFSLSAKLASASLPVTVDMHDVTTYADDGVKRFIPGQESSTAALSGFIDADAATDAAAWTTATPLTITTFGLAIGTRVQLIDALRATYTVGTRVNGVASFDIAAQSDGFADFGVSLHDLEAETLDEEATSVDNGAATANGGVGVLHVTAFSGFSSAVLRVKHSTDNFAANTANLVNFTTVTGVGGERIEVAPATTVRQYLRASLDVTGTGSITYQMSFARR